MLPPKGWKIENNFLQRVFERKNFLDAVAFVREVAKIAEESNHHPDIEIFSYKHVRVKTTSHDQGNKITEKDIALAEKINAI